MIPRDVQNSKAIKNCPGGRNRTRRVGMAIIGTILGLYLLLLAAVTLLQRHLMYFPSKDPLSLLKGAANERGFAPWLAPSGDFIGWKRLSTNRQVLGQVLILHGNGGHALYWADQAEILQTLASLDVYILEFPGYGPRGGQPKEVNIFAAASEGLSLLNTNQKTFLLGESLGTGVAAYLAGKYAERISGVLLIAPYNNLSAVAQHHFKIFPVKWILFDKYESDKYLKNYKGPVGILLGGEDRVVPSRFGRRLYDGYQGPKKLWEIPEAGHEELHRAPLEWWREAVEFWRKGLPTR